MELRDQLQNTLGAAYTLERELGGGGMSRVFVAEDAALGRKVVVKVLPAEMSGGVNIERFKREIAVAARLQHPHIVPLLSAGDMNGLPYFTMPLVRGESLRARLSSRGELPIIEAVRILREVASALAFAHSQGVVHRDVKPENVLMSGDAAMVTDFGVAKALSDATGAHALTSVGVALGTPAYMAPEQVAADPGVDHRADVYAWGVLAYELLAGATPFAGRTTSAMLSAHVSETPSPVAARRPSAPPSLAQLVMRCLEKRPADRPQSANEIVASLDAMVTPATTLPLDKPRGRSRIFATGAGIVVIIAVVAGLLFARTRSAGGAIRSVAVIPFENRGGDTTADYLADGLTDGVMSELTRTPTLRVAARASARSFKGKNSPPQEISKALGVATVLTAQIQRLGSRLRVSAELDSANGDAIWQGTVEREAADPLALRDDIVREISSALRLKLVSGALTPKSHAPDPVTYDLYLHGVHWGDVSTKDGLEQARSYFERAIARDSLYAPSYAALAWTLVALADAYYQPSFVVPATAAAARRAVALDDHSAQAHAILGVVNYTYLRNWQEAGRNFDRAIAIDSTYPEAWFYRSYLRMAMGDRTGAVEDIRRTLRLDPLSASVNYFAVWMLGIAGELDSAIVQNQRTKAIAPDFAYIESAMGEAYRAKGDYRSALPFDRQATAIIGRPTSGLIISLANLGDRAEAEKAFSETVARLNKGEWSMPELIARSALALGRTDQALDLLDKGLAGNSGGVAFLPWMSGFRALVGNPRFERYLERAGLRGPIH